MDITQQFDALVSRLMGNYGIFIVNEGGFRTIVCQEIHEFICYALDPYTRVDSDSIKVKAHKSKWVITANSLDNVKIKIEFRLLKDETANRVLSNWKLMNDDEYMKLYNSDKSTYVPEV